MYLSVSPGLLLYIVPYYSLIPVLAYGIHIVPARPELTTPEHLLHLGMDAEDFFGGDAFNYLSDRLWCHHWDTLDKKMDVVLIGSDLDEMHLMPLADTFADIFEGMLHLVRKDFSPILCRTHHVIEKKGLIMSLSDMFTHPPILT
jgi:hypothetical protein